LSVKRRAKPAPGIACREFTIMLPPLSAVSTVKNLKTEPVDRLELSAGGATVDDDEYDKCENTQLLHTVRNALAPRRNSADEERVVHAVCALLEGKAILHEAARVYDVRVHAIRVLAERVLSGKREEIEAALGPQVAKGFDDVFGTMQDGHEAREKVAGRSLKAKKMMKSKGALSAKLMSARSEKLMLSYFRYSTCIIRTKLIYYRFYT